MILHAYTWLLRACIPFVLLWYAWRGFAARSYWQRLPERFGFVPPLRALRVLWIHAASMGEVNAAVPLVKALARRYPEHRLLVTTMTVTGAAQVSALFGDDVAHRYLPFDLPRAAARFLDGVQPDVAVVMETELWPNLFHACRARSIPLMVANLRLSEASAARYLKVRELMARTLAQASVLAAQTGADAERLRRFGVPAAAIHVTGNIKYDLTLPASLREAADALRGEWGRDRPVWLAASTREGEDELLLAARRELLGRFPNHLLVLVPRHPERFPIAARLAKKAGCRVALRSAGRTRLDPRVDVLIGDTMGELQLFYGAADVAFIGGSLVPAGGHNLLEAAAVGTPVVFGPHMFNFEEVARAARTQGAGVQVSDPGQLAPALGDFMGNANRRFEAGEAGMRLVAENRGAVDRTMRLVETLLPRQQAAAADQ